MFTKLFSDIRILILEYLTDKELVLLDSSLCCKDRNMILNEYKYIENLNITDKYINYFIKRQIKQINLSISNIDSLDKIGEIEVNNLDININCDNDKLGTIFDLAEKFINEMDIKLSGLSLKVNDRKIKN